MSDVTDPSPALHSDGPAVATALGLADQQTLGAIAVKRTRTPMVITDPRQAHNPIILANQAFLDLTGYAAKDVVGQNPRFMQGKDTAPEQVSEIRAAIEAQREVSVEILNYRKDGSTFWNRLYISPIHDDHGKLLYFFASQDDVTEFRRIQALEATERRLLKEVDHRARNVLAIVNGIVRLSRSDDAKAYATAIQQRVRALAGAHSLLADGGWREVALHQIVRQQLEVLQIDRAQAEGADILVSSVVVQPLALVIHELLSNAVLHGALSTPSGDLTIRWRPDVGKGGFYLRWEEAHGPTPSSSRRSGFGSAMLRGMIERQLQGQVEQTWSSQGLIVEITVPGSVEPMASTSNAL